ncbi:MAG: hypothetical protein SPH02_01215 [Campylobacter sp.]|nr:hypothetical protein [Campylobacter sp.]
MARFSSSAIVVSAFIFKTADYKSKNALNDEIIAFRSLSKLREIKRKKQKFFEKFYRILDFKNSKRSEKFFKNAIKFSLD